MKMKLNKKLGSAERGGRTQAQALQQLLDKFVSADAFVHNGVLMVETPNFVFAGASGFSNPDVKLPMRPEDQFQLASVTKIFTASALMTLVEEGLIDLDAGIGGYMPPSLTRGLHVFQGQEHGEDITPRQLLSHTSGLADFFGDGERGDGDVLPFIAHMQADPNRLWDPLEIVMWTKRNLHAHFPPGSGWHYSDTGLLLAGLIIEQVTNKALHDFMRGST